MRRVGSALWAWYSNRFVASGGIFMRGLGTWFRSRGVWFVSAVLRRSRGYGEIPSQTASLDRAAGAFLRTLLSALLVVLPTGAWAASTGCDEINNLGGIFTVDSNGVGTDKFTSPGLHALADGERVTYSWSGNTKGAYIYIAWTQNNGSTYAPSSVLDSTATSGSGSFIFSGTSPSDYFQVGIADTNYITEPSIPKPSSRNSTVAISLSCSSTPVLGVAMSHAGNAAQGGLMSYTIFPSVTNSPTTNAPLTASLNLPLGMNISSLSGTGWTCTPSGQTGSCTRTGSFGPGTGPTLNLIAAFAANATTPLVPSVTLSGGGAIGSASASDSTVVVQAPTVTSISPTAGPVGGGTSVVITGTNLSNPTGVTFGGIPSGSFVGGSATQITAVAPAGSGTVDVRVTTVAGTSATSAADQYTYVAAPIAANLDAGTVAFGTATPIDLSGAITGSHTSIAVPSGPTHGTVAITGNVVSYTPNAGYAGPDSFTYTATGVGGTSAPATVSLTVAQGTQTIAFGTLPNTSLSASPLTLTATASSGLAVSFTSQTTPVCTVSGTTLTLLQPGTCTVQADQAGNGSYSAAPSVTSSFTVTPAPLAVNSAGATGLIVGSTFSQTNAASGGIAPYAYALNAGALPPGTSLNTATGIVSGTPTVAGSFSYQISVTDSQPVTALGPIVTITMAKGNQSIGFTSSAPSSAAVGGSYTVAATATSGLTVSYSLNATSTGCALAGTTVTFVGPGTCRIDANQAGDANWNAAAQAQQTFTVAPAGAVSVALSYAPSTATVGLSGQLTITFTNPNAVATPGFITSLHSNSSVFTRLPGVGGSCGVSAGNTSAPSGAQLDFINIQIPSGTCTVTVPYQASGAGLASFNVDGFSPTGYPSSPGAVSAAIAVTPSVTAISPGSGPPSQVVTVTGTGFSTTPGNNTVQFGSAAGNVTAASATSLTVTAPATGSGNVTVTVSVNGQTSPAGASFTFIDRPIAADKPGVAAAYNTGTAIDLSTSISGGPHSGITIASAASHGTLSIAGDVVTYTPATGYFGPDSFTYTASGPGGISNVATVSLTVATPSAPVAADKSGIAVPYGSSGTTIDLSSTITGTYTSMAIATGPMHGAVSTSGTVITYTPAAGFFGPDSFTYTATGPGGTSAPATVSLTVATPAAPTAKPGTGSVVSSTQAQKSLDIDLSTLVAGEFTAIELVGTSSHGMVALRGTPNVIATYTPNPGFSGTDAFDFVAVGPGGRSAPATVTITVTGTVPTAAAKTAKAVDNQPVSIELTEGATEGPFTGAAIVSIAPADKATAKIVEEGPEGARTYRLEVTPAPHYGGTILITYTLSNLFGTSAPATVTITVTARPDPSLDPNIRALSDAQVESTRRFAQTQSRNFLQRTEQLHNGGGSGKARMGVSLGILDMRRSVSGAFGMGTPTDELELVDRMRGRPGNYATGFDPRSAMNARSANAGADSPEGSEQGEAPSGSSAERPVGSVAVWTGGQLALGTRNRTNDRDKISIATSGLSAGADIKLSPDVTVGLGGGIGFDDSEIGDNAARLHGRSSVAAAYGSTAPFPGMFVDFVIGYGDLRFKTRRIVDGALTRGSRDGSMWFGAASTGIDRISGNLRWSLYGRGEWLSGTLDAYRENGAGIMDLRFDKRDANSLAGVLGGRFELDKRLLIGNFRPRVRLEWSHEFQDSSAQFLDYADIPGQAFYGIRTEGWTRDQYEVALGGGLYTLSTWVIDMELGLRGASNQRDGRLTVRVSKDF